MFLPQDFKMETVEACSPNYVATDDGNHSGRESPLSTTADEKMAAVAARIQDRAMQLLSEQTKLNDAKVELSKLLESIEQESLLNDSHRQKLLNMTNSRNGMELELFELVARKRKHTELIERVHQETEMIERQIEIIEKQLEDDVKNVYSSHQLEMELYMQSFERTLVERQRRTSQRAEQVDKLRCTSQTLKEEENTMIQERNILESEIQRLEKAGEKEDEEVSSLATQVREALAEASINISIGTFVSQNQTMRRTNVNCLFAFPAHEM